MGQDRTPPTGDGLGFCVVCGWTAPEDWPPDLRPQPVEVEAVVEWGGDRLCRACAEGRAETFLRWTREKVETDYLGRGRPPKGPEDRMGDISRYLWAVQMAREFGVLEDAPYNEHIRAYRTVLDTMQWALDQHAPGEAAPEGAEGPRGEDEAAWPVARRRGGRKRRFERRERLVSELVPAFKEASKGGTAQVTQEAVRLCLSPPPSAHTLIDGLGYHGLAWDDAVAAWERGGGMRRAVDAAAAALTAYLRGPEDATP